MKEAIMTEKKFTDLPARIKTHIESVLRETSETVNEEATERYARAWLDKYELFQSQIHAVGMEIVEKLAISDKRAAILLTYSGSLVSFGTAKPDTRALEYASIKFRADVPDFITAKGVTIKNEIKQDSIAEFTDCPLKQSSEIYRIAVCPEGTSETEQDLRVREATIFLTNGFIKINRTVTDIQERNVEQFTSKAIVSFISKKHGLTQVATKAILDDYLSTIESGVLLGERVTVGKLGTLFLKARSARQARVMKNLVTGEDILVPAKDACLVPKFSLSKTLKEKAALVDTAIIANGQSDEDEDDND